MSRYPQMRQSTAYDRSLLAGAPELTNAERQAGYSIDALEQGRYPVVPPSLPPKERIPPPAAVDPFRDPVQPAYVPSPIPPKEKWWKTKQGRIIIGLVVIVLIGILCGIAAGAATAKNRRNTTLLAAPSATSDGANVLPSPTSSTSSTRSSNALPFTSVASTPEAEPTRTTISAPFGGPLLTTTPRQQTSLAGSSTRLSGGTLPTPTAPSTGNGNGNGGGDGGDDNTPTICFWAPFLPGCD